MARTVLVTGAATGIGEACALRLDGLGWKVFAGVRRDEDGARLRSRSSANLTPVLCDVTSGDQVAAAVATIASAGGLDALVNNAGVAFGGPIEYVPLDDWRSQFEVNLIGQVRV